jgi:hypothetical protein
MVEGDRFTALLGEFFVEHIEHFQKGHVRGDILQDMRLEIAQRVAVFLAPDN